MNKEKYHVLTLYLNTYETKVIYQTLITDNHNTWLF